MRRNPTSGKDCLAQFRAGVGHPIPNALVAPYLHTLAARHAHQPLEVAPLAQGSTDSRSATHSSAHQATPREGAKVWRPVFPPGARPLLEDRDDKVGHVGLRYEPFFESCSFAAAEVTLYRPQHKFQRKPPNHQPNAKTNQPKRDRAWPAKGCISHTRGEGAHTRRSQELKQVE